MKEPELSPRSGRILATVVRHYINTGEPVASVVVARRGALGVSSATIRSVLSRLEEQGLVRQPHTSAGRVPTDRGYRFYVDLLLEHRRPGGNSPIVDSIRQAAIDGSTLEELLAGASRVLSQESHHVGFALSVITEAAPPQDRVRRARRQCPRRDHRRGQANHAEGRGRRRVAPSDDLRRAADAVNREFSGLLIDEVRAAIVAQLRKRAASTTS